MKTETLKSGVTVLANGDRRETWIAMRKKDGSPQGEAVAGFGLFESSDELLEAVQKRLVSDPPFRMRSCGHQFFAARIDWIVDVSRDGQVNILWRNENPVVK